MNEPVRKRTSAWKIVGIVVGVIVLSIVALVLWATAAGSRKYARMQERSRAHLEEVKSSDSRRPVLRGTAEAGNAWDDYAQAVAEIKKFGNAQRLGEIVEGTPNADPEIGKAALAAHAVVVDHLRRGAGRESSRYPYQWEKGNNMPSPPMLDALNVSNLALLKARALVEEGKSREAAGILLDVLQFGRDLASDGIVISYMIGTALLNLGFNETREQLVAGKIDAAALEDLARGLEILDRSYPVHGRAMVNEALLFVMDESIVGGGPSRMLYADMVERTSNSTAAAAKAESLTWAEAQEEMKRIEAESQKAWNPFARMTVPALTNSGAIGRTSRARLRALRIAIHARRTGATLDLDDPFGSKMRVEEKDGKLRIWSIGKDGVDGAGAGDWKSGLNDIVLELKK